MKTTICWIVAFIILGWSCTSTSGKTADATLKEDSLEYYPPTPVPLDQKQFRQYYRILSNYFDSTLLRRNFNGGILIAKEGSVIYEKYAGFSDFRTKDPMTDSTTLHIASTGKTFTGMAILKMVQENLISLDDTLTKFFPKLPYHGVTVKMLLNHRSGLPNYLYFVDQKKLDREKCLTNDDILNELYTAKPNRSYAPNRRFSYSNTNYVLLASIIEKVSGLTFPEYMRQHIFEPLGMRHTYVFNLADKKDPIPSFKANGGFWQNDCFEGTYGDKNIYSTPRDLLKWDQAFYTDRLINKTLLDSAFIPYSNERPSVHNYGLGWRLLMIPNGKKVIYHNGRWHGFNAAFARLVDEKVTIIILGNKYNSRIYSSARHAYDIFGDYDQNGERDEEEAALVETVSAEGSTSKIAK